MMKIYCNDEITVESFEILELIMVWNVEIRGVGSSRLPETLLHFLENCLRFDPGKADWGS